MNCDKLINTAINGACETPALVTGLEDVAVLINRDDIDFSTIDLSSVPHATLASIPFKAGKTGYMVKQINDSFKGTKTEMAKNRFRNNFKNIFAFVVFDKLGQPAAGSTGAGTVAVTAGGTNYVAGDLLYITGGTAGNLAILKVTTVSSGVVTAVSILNVGSGYSTGAGQATTTNSALGAGCTINISATTTSSVPSPTTTLINNIANGRFVVVYQNRTKNLAGDINYECIGLYRGLKCTKLEIDRYNEETNGAWTVEMEEDNVAEGPIPFYTTSIAATNTAFNALAAMY